jgi:hypothetical protein
MRNAKHPIPELDRKGLREFGIVTGAFAGGLFGLLLPWLLDYPYPAWPWVISGVLGLWAAFAPMTLRPLYRVWMEFGLLMSKITTPIIMGIVFYLVITPFALGFKLMGKDAMRRKFDDCKSYRVTRTRIRDDSLEHPY